MSYPDPCIASTPYGSETHRRHPCSKLGKVGGTSCTWECIRSKGCAIGLAAALRCLAGGTIYFIDIIIFQWDLKPFWLGGLFLVFHWLDQSSATSVGGSSAFHIYIYMCVCVIIWYNYNIL